MNNQSENLDIMDLINLNVIWKEHMENTTIRINNMWSYLLYNQFCDKEIISLKNENTELRKELEDNKTDVIEIKKEENTI